LGGDFGFQGGRFLQVKVYSNVELIPKKQYLLLWNQSIDAVSTPWFITLTKVIKHISDWSRINQTTVAWFCERLHCANYPRPLRWSQAMRSSRR